MSAKQPRCIHFGENIKVGSRCQIVCFGEQREQHRKSLFVICVAVPGGWERNASCVCF